MYSAEILDHFQHPRNAGDLEAPASSVQMENPACGDILKLSLKLEGRRIADIRFRAQGCVPAIACGSAITELAKGKTVEEARQISKEDLLRKVGGVPDSFHSRLPLGDGHTAGASAGDADRGSTRAIRRSHGSDAVVCVEDSGEIAC